MEVVYISPHMYTYAHILYITSSQFWAQIFVVSFWGCFFFLIVDSSWVLQSVKRLGTQCYCSFVLKLSERCQREFHYLYCLLSDLKGKKPKFCGFVTPLTGESHKQTKASFFAALFSTAILVFLVLKTYLFPLMLSCYLGSRSWGKILAPSIERSFFWISVMAGVLQGKGLHCSSSIAVCVFVCCWFPVLVTGDISLFLFGNLHVLCSPFLSLFKFSCNFWTPSSSQAVL